MVVVKASVTINNMRRIVPALCYRTLSDNILVYPLTRGLFGTVWSTQEALQSVQCQLENLTEGDPLAYCSRMADLPTDMVRQLFVAMEINGGGANYDPQRLEAWTQNLRNGTSGVVAQVPCPHCGWYNPVTMTDITFLTGISHGIRCAQLNKSCRLETPPIVSQPPVVDLTGTSQGATMTMTGTSATHSGTVFGVTPATSSVPPGAQTSVSSSAATHTNLGGTMGNTPTIPEVQAFLQTAPNTQNNQVHWNVGTTPPSVPASTPSEWRNLERGTFASSPLPQHTNASNPHLSKGQASTSAPVWSFSATTPNVTAGFNGVTTTPTTDPQAALIAQLTAAVQLLAAQQSAQPNVAAHAVPPPPMLGAVPPPPNWQAGFGWGNNTGYWQGVGGNSSNGAIPSFPSTSTGWEQQQQPNGSSANGTGYSQSRGGPPPKGGDNYSGGPNNSCHDFQYGYGQRNPRDGGENQYDWRHQSNFSSRFKTEVEEELTNTVLEAGEIFHPEEDQDVIIVDEDGQRRGHPSTYVRGQPLRKIKSSPPTVKERLELKKLVEDGKFKDVKHAFSRAMQDGSIPHLTGRGDFPDFVKWENALLNHFFNNEINNTALRRRLATETFKDNANGWWVAHKKMGRETLILSWKQLVEAVRTELVPTGTLGSIDEGWDELRYEGNKDEYFQKVSNMKQISVLTPAEQQHRVTKPFGQEMLREWKSVLLRQKVRSLPNAEWEQLVSLQIDKIEATDGFKSWPKPATEPVFRNPKLRGALAEYPEEELVHIRACTNSECHGVHCDEPEVTPDTPWGMDEEEWDRQVVCLRAATMGIPPPMPSAHRIGKGDKPCFVCGRDDHTWINCPHKKKGKCACCGSRDHYTRFCKDRFHPDPKLYPPRNVGSRPGNNPGN